MISINKKQFVFKEGETILEAARRTDHYIPTLCEMADINHRPGTCRVCLVEAKVPGSDEPMFVTACNTPTQDGMSIATRTAEVRDMQRMQVELLLADHDQDCASCVRHGDCEIQDVAQFVGVQKSSFDAPNLSLQRRFDDSSAAMVRDMSKCIRCMRCVSVCRDTQGVDAMVVNGVGLACSVGLRYDLDQAQSDCVACGQCIMVCPTGALSEKDDTEKVIAYLDDPDVTTVFQFAPAVRVGFAAETGLENVEGQIIAALRKMGADIVLDTNFAADLVIMEEGNEVLSHLAAKKRPTFTSCCPGWVNFAERHIPEILPYISSTRSPQQCLGSIAKTYLAEKMQIDPKRMRMISIMPCVAKKEERDRPMFEHDGVQDIDVVLTIREFSRLLKKQGIDLATLAPSSFDNPYMSEYTGAGAIFGTTGGVMEAAVRTLYYVANGKELDGIEVAALRDFDDVRSATVAVGGSIGDIKIAICHGLKAARQLSDAVLAGKADFDFIEVMACPGGCADGGGHMRAKKRYRPNALARREALFTIDRNAPKRQSHRNEQVQRLYADYLDAPMSEKAHHLLHTYYVDQRKTVDRSLKEIWKSAGRHAAVS